MSTAAIILGTLAALALWAGSLYVRPFGACPACKGKGHIIGNRGRRAKTCPRCEGRRRIQRPGSRTVHRAARAVRKGQAAAGRHQQEED